MAIRAGVGQRQTAGLVPEHILGKSVLKMNLQELQEFILAETSENPALVLEETRTCGICGSALSGSFCTACGGEMISTDEPQVSDFEDWDAEPWAIEGGRSDSDLEPLSFVASPVSLEDHLKEQISSNLLPEEAPLAEFIIGLLDEDGYLREPIYEIAREFRLSVPQVETVLFKIQSFDPAGIASRDLRECLLSQLRQSEDQHPDRELAEAILDKHWDEFSSMQWSAIAEALNVYDEDVKDALDYIRTELNPYPASAFRDPWQNLAPRLEAKLTPDIIVKETEFGLVADVIDPISRRVTVDEVYSTLFAEVIRQKKGMSEQDRERIKECVLSAKSLIDALEFRQSALRTVADQLVKCQEEYFKHGPDHLRPINRKQLSAMIGLHESTVCRATNEKTIQLPSGEVVSLDVLFDTALPVKEMVRKLASERVNGKPLSDSEIAARLQAAGIQIARRTVAKYRGQLQLPTADLRA